MSYNDLTFNFPSVLTVFGSSPTFAVCFSISQRQEHSKNVKDALFSFCSNRQSIFIQFESHEDFFFFLKLQTRDADLESALLPKRVNE